MASIKTVTLPDGTTFDIKAKYDIDGNEIASSYVKSSEKGTAGGVATLDSNGKVPSSQIPGGGGGGGSVSEVDTGVGLTGGPITTSGTIKANLLSETPLVNVATAATEVADRIYPVAVDGAGALAVNVPWTDHIYAKATGQVGSIVNVSGASTPSLSYSRKSIPNITSVGTAPSLTITSVDCDDITDWSAGTLPSVSASEGVVTFSAGSLPSLSYTAKSVGSASNWSPGSVPTLGSQIVASEINNFDQGSLPTIEYEYVDVVTDIYNPYESQP